MNISKKLAFFALLVLSLPTHAIANDLCDDLWFTRNWLMNEAGYCFKSNLGKEIFDNSDCYNLEPVIAPLTKTRAKEIQKIEREFGCKVNTRKSRLDIQYFSIRRRLELQPLADGHESSCIGYNGEKEIPVFIGTDVASEIVGYVQYGDTIAYNHLTLTGTEPGWSFVSAVWRSGAQAPILGWVRSEITCDQYAG